MWRVDHGCDRDLESLGIACVTWEKEEVKRGFIFPIWERYLLEFGLDSTPESKPERVLG
jgi:hypothetical protein